MDAAVIHWMRRRFVTGFFVMVPLIISLLAVIWVFGIVDGIAAPLYVSIFGPGLPGSRRAMPLFFVHSP